MIAELNERSRTVFRFIVDSYLSTGDPVGSRTISQLAGLSLSPASIRNTMSDLEMAGLLLSPHISAGRLPTEAGLRLYIDGLMQVGALSAEEQREIDATCAAKGRTAEEVLERTTTLLSGLSACASLVIAPKTKSAVKQIQFVDLGPGEIPAVLVTQNGMVENRIIETDEIIPPGALVAAANYLNARLAGRTIEAAHAQIMEDIRTNQTQLDAITQRLVRMGLALPSDDQTGGRIIVRGQTRLLEDVRAIADLERARELLAYLEEQKNMLSLLGSINEAEGVQIFIGAENRIFDQAGWSLIIAPYKDAQKQIVGAIGVIGPTRLNYDRIIPMVDYTSRVMARVVEE